MFWKSPGAGNLNPGVFLGVCNTKGVDNTNSNGNSNSNNDNNSKSNTCFKSLNSNNKSHPKSNDIDFNTFLKRRLPLSLPPPSVRCL